MLLPVRRYLPFGARNGLRERVGMWRSERRPLVVLLGAVIPEPILARFKALNDLVVSALGVCRGVLARGVVTTADVAASGAAA
jgi:hypothetical protein